MDVKGYGYGRKGVQLKYPHPYTNLSKGSDAEAARRRRWDKVGVKPPDCPKPPRKCPEMGRVAMFWPRICKRTDTRQFCRGAVACLDVFAGDLSRAMPERRQRSNMGLLFLWRRLALWGIIIPLYNC